MVFVTGSDGFLGKRLVLLLRSRGVAVREIGRRVDLRNYPEAEASMHGCSGREVYALAGRNGGIAYNATHPSRVFHDNTVIALNTLKAARVHGASKVLFPLASCGYPAGAGDLLVEETYLDGMPHHTVACHGMARRNILLACRFASGGPTRAVCVCPPTLYGPGDAHGTRAKVVAAMVERFVAARRRGHPSVTCWGTGSPLRELMHVDDCACLMVEAMRKWDGDYWPLNLASGQEVTVKRLATLVAAAARYTGTVEWDASRPDGAMRKRLCGEKMARVLGQRDFIPLEGGLAGAVADFEERFPS